MYREPINNNVAVTSETNAFLFIYFKTINFNKLQAGLRPRNFSEVN